MSTADYLIAFAIGIAILVLILGTWIQSRRGDQ